MYCKWGKRIFDILGSSILLFLLLPLMTVIYFLVRCFLGAPVLFIQIRPGLNEKPFRAREILNNLSQLIRLQRQNAAAQQARATYPRFVRRQKRKF